MMTDSLSLDKLGHMTFIIACLTFCLVNIFPVYIPLLGAPLYVRGYPARPSAYLQQLAIFVYGGPRSRAKI